MPNDTLLMSHTAADSFRDFAQMIGAKLEAKGTEGKLRAFLRKTMGETAIADYESDRPGNRQQFVEMLEDKLRNSARLRRTIHKKMGGTIPDEADTTRSLAQQAVNALDAEGDAGKLRVLLGHVMGASVIAEFESTRPGNRQQFVDTLECLFEQNAGLARAIRNEMDGPIPAEPGSNQYLAQRTVAGLETEDAEGKIHVLLRNNLDDIVIDEYESDRKGNRQKFTATLEGLLNKSTRFARAIRHKIDGPIPAEPGSNSYLAHRIAAGLETEGAKGRLHAFLLNHTGEIVIAEYESGQMGNRPKFTATLATLFRKNPDSALQICQGMGWAMPFGVVFSKEQVEIAASRKNRKGGSLVPPGTDVIGLALSGGGIRSATFNLGVLQALASHKLLRSIDYLSTVSGGGYIGSWLLAWLKRKGFGNVSQQLMPNWKEHGGKEPPEIEFLRSFSNYLTPRIGLFSADTWSLVTIWARNLLLNLTILILAISAALLLPRLVVSLSHCGIPFIYFAFMVVLMVIAVFCTGTNLNLLAHHQEIYPRYSKQGVIQWTIVVPTLVASWLGSCWLWNQGQGLISHPYAWVIWMLGGALLTLFVWLIAWLCSLIKNGVAHSEPSNGKAKPSIWRPLVRWSLLEGAVGGVLFFALACLYSRMGEAGYPGNNVHFVAWGPGLVAVIFGLMVSLQIGVMGSDFPDERREWWSRASALIGTFSLAWVALFLFALYSPLMVEWAGHWVSGAVTLGWVAHTITGVVGASGAKTGGGGPDDNTGVLIKAAPLVFVIGLLALLSFSIYCVVPHENPKLHHEAVAVTVNLNVRQDSPDKSASVSASVNSAPAGDKLSYGDLAETYWCSSVKTDGWTGLRVFIFVLLCASASFLLSRRVDINEFSMHLLYRNRLVRCYLGASHQAEGQPAAERTNRVAEDVRNPNPFTGFDPTDDKFLAGFTQDAPRQEGELESVGPYVGPYPILNTTLNVTHGKRLAWQERKAESFSFTPLYCGFAVPPDRQPVVRGKKKLLEPNGYRPTRDYLYPGEGPYLGTAMGISGAAASPSMGYHSSSPLAFLLTVFDVRLGWWAGNPRHRGTWGVPPWMRRGPGLGILYLLRELFGSSDDESRYVYLSDGGHFENLGIYELVRRECRLIVACDAGADKDYQFEDLGNAIRKCRIDLGVDISIPIEPLRPRENKDDGTKWSPLHWAVGIVHYEKLDASKKPGLLIYLKASLTGDEPADVLEYKNEHPAFPHDTTANQFFTESQFESYRKLGEHILAKYISAETDGPRFVCEPSKWEHLNPDELREEVDRFNKRPEKKV